MHVCEEQRGQTRETHNSYINCRLTAYLYFHGHLPAILHPRQVNLADGRCCKRTLLKRLQLVSPVGTQITVQRFLQTDTNKSYFCSSSYSTLYTVVKTCPYLYIYISCIQLWLPVNVKKKEDPYCHLFDWHEVSALSYTLKDLGQLRVDESVIWNAETDDFIPIKS